MLGLRFRGKLSGTYYLFERQLEDRPALLELEVGLRQWKRVLVERTGDVEGQVTLVGLAHARPVRGTIMFLFDVNRAPYDLVFTSDDGRTLRLRGQHDFIVSDPVASVTSVPASLYDASGEEIGRAVVRFDLRSDLGRLLCSLRPTWRAKEERT